MIGLSHRAKRTNIKQLLLKVYIHEKAILDWRWSLEQGAQKWLSQTEEWRGAHYYLNGLWSLSSTHVRTVDYLHHKHQPFCFVFSQVMMCFRRARRRTNFLFALASCLFHVLIADIWRRCKYVLIHSLETFVDYSDWAKLFMKQMN